MEATKIVDSNGSRDLVHALRAAGSCLHRVGVRDYSIKISVLIIAYLLAVSVRKIFIRGRIAMSWTREYPTFGTDWMQHRPAAIRAA